MPFDSISFRVTSVIKMDVKLLLILIYLVECHSIKMESSDPQVCPQLLSKYTNSVDELLGNWHVVLLILDETGEQFEERSVCIQGRLLKVNSTNMIQVWNVEMPEILRQDKTEVDFPTKIIEPGIWLVQSPLGGEFHGTVIDSDGSSYLLIVYCGWQENQLMHMMTLAMSRNNIATPSMRLQLLSSLVRNGYEPFKSKIISWSNC